MRRNVNTCCYNYANNKNLCHVYPKDHNEIEHRQTDRQIHTHAHKLFTQNVVGQVELV